MCSAAIVSLVVTSTAKTSGVKQEKKGPKP
jgi:hypothetical protein